MKEKLIEFLNGIPESKDTEADQPAPFKNVKYSYAKKGTVTRANGRLRGCFSDDVSGACDQTKYSTILESAIIQYDYNGRCGAGDDNLIYSLLHS